jgi:protein O-mannosyl-transferase
MTKEATSLWRPLLLFVTLGFVAYSTVIDSYFLSDDFVQIGKVLEGDWSTAWGREHGGFFRPLFILSYILDSRLWGRNPAGYHLTNTALHALNSYLVYRLALRFLHHQRLSETEKRVVCLAAGLLFLLHPSHTEAVSWISGRPDLLSTFFCLTALLAYLHYRKTRGRFTLLLSLSAFALALLAKESAVSLPLLVLGAGLLLPSMAGNRKAALRETVQAGALFFAVLFCFVLIRRAVLGAWLGGYGASQHLNFSPGWIRDRFLQATLRSLLPVLPQELSHILLKPLKSTVFILGALACMAFLMLLLKRRRRLYDRAGRCQQNRFLLLLALMFILSLLPVINLRMSPFDTQGERFIYWPSAFISILFPDAAFVLLRSLKIWLALMLCLLVFYSVSLYRTNRAWSEASALSRSILEELASPESSGKSLLVINVPDNLAGVPVFHNGLEEALRLFQQKGRTATMRLLSLHAIGSARDEIELKREGDVFSLRLPGGADGFTRIESGLDCVEVPERSDRALRFRLHDCPDNQDLFFFNQGRMYRVLSNQP